MANITYRKRTNGWEYRFDVGKVDGKRKQRSKSGFKTKAEAIKAGTEEFNKYHKTGVVLNDTDLSVAEYLDYWFMNVCVMENKSSTVSNYAGIIETHLKPHFGIYKLKVLNTAAIQEYVYYLRSKGLTKSTVSGIIGCLSSALNYAEITLNYIDRNPCDKVKLPDFKNKSDKGHYNLTDETINECISVLDDQIYFTTAIMIGFYTGLRIGEVFGLTWDDIDFENQTITVNRQIVKRNFGVDMRKVLEIRGKKTVKSEWYTADLKTDAANRTVYFVGELLQQLKKLKEWQNKNIKEYDEYYTNHYLKPEVDEKGETIYRVLPVSASLPTTLEKIDLVFVRENGEYISTDSFKYASRIIHNKVTKDFDFHSLRHTHATRLAENGINPISLQYRLGHTRIETTLKYYVHNSDKMKADEVDKINEVFGSDHKSLTTT